MGFGLVGKNGACGRFPNLPHAVFNPPLVENIESGISCHRALGHAGKISGRPRMAKESFVTISTNSEAGILRRADSGGFHPAA
jgi:hypothetical protein